MKNEKPVTPSVTPENAPIFLVTYCSDDNGNWYYKDMQTAKSCRSELCGYVPVYFSQDGIRGGFAEDG